MNKLFQKRTLIHENMVLLIGICLSIYFSYHLMQGNRSYLRLMSLENNIVKLSDEQIQLKAEREQMERKVVMLRPGSINKDLLEERARAVLGYTRADEKVVVVPNAP